MASGRRMHYHSNQPTREACPCCSKKGLGKWLYVHADFEPSRRVRNCRYCRYTEREEWSSDVGEYGGWKRVETVQGRV